ncbi:MULTISPECIES: LysR family transcriptional regulator [unclassified Bradyrhizobium]|uniref:LysR family transcriptional regulator n=1 Tax=unclassified Bradyrhizobium TaxID=2631580 RepID=UPI0016058D33|nr:MULTISPECIES: LysR family transcriptional regulator [unclassified Bradyrhizobium]MBB4262794.1 DNA-binding transcriptional LysR family regulator [Bradyrhizobium sp. CIR3A]MBB4360663.1 DNA-binding transcriptional LysR family regulator [Bradyrhizobium sp. CIR18]MBB4429576.1 DNA-binding transcriptional LysR family regulator [Bradyrhizobium sp. CIR48]
MRHLTFRQLNIFATVGDHENLAAAGRILGLSAATLSDAIRDVEAALGKEMFDRSSRKMRLSADGRALLPDAKKLVREARALTLRHRSRSVLCIGASMTVGNHILPPLLGDFALRHPQAEITVQIRNTDDVIQLLAEHAVDAAIVEGRVTDSSLDVRVWRRDPLVIIAAPGHPLARTSDLAALGAARWILREDGSSTRWSFETAVADWPVAPYVLMTVGSNELLKAAVMRGLGLSCIAASAVAAEVRRGELDIVPLNCVSFQQTLSIVQRANRRSSAIVQEFLDLCLAAHVPAGVEADSRSGRTLPLASGSAETANVIGGKDASALASGRACNRSGPRKRDHSHLENGLPIGPFAS